MCAEQRINRINVTKTFLPPLDQYRKYLDRIWESGQITNQGSVVEELESRLKTYLDVPQLQLVANGTLALQLALQTLGIKRGEIITTPFSYVASVSAILWEGHKPVFVDIDEEMLCIDPKKIEAAITPRTKAILAVHVFGNPCDVEAIDEISKKHSIPVIYDAAHTFGVRYKEKSLLDYGDVSICSFHATKLFHTIEGGAVVSRDPNVNKKLDLTKRFGHLGDDHRALGINAKMSEPHAAMGLCNLDHVDGIIKKRKQVSDLYTKLLGKRFKRPKRREGTNYNYSYYPIMFESEDELMKKNAALQAQDVYPRRYFSPSLNKLPYLRSQQSCPVSEDIARRILCLPLYADLSEQDIIRICKVLKK